jgi:hypothetical protein
MQRKVATNYIKNPQNNFCCNRRTHGSDLRRFGKYWLNLQFFIKTKIWKTIKPKQHKLICLWYRTTKTSGCTYLFMIRHNETSNIIICVFIGLSDFPDSLFSNSFSNHLQKIRDNKTQKKRFLNSFFSKKHTKFEVRRSFMHRLQYVDSIHAPNLRIRCFLLNILQYNSVYRLVKNSQDRCSLKKNFNKKILFHMVTKIPNGDQKSRRHQMYTFSLKNRLERYLSGYFQTIVYVICWVLAKRTLLRNYSCSRTIFGLIGHISLLRITFIRQLNVKVFQKTQKKIWCASRARVNLPHIGNRECFQFVLLQNFINET